MLFCFKKFVLNLLFLNILLFNNLIWNGIVVLILRIINLFSVWMLVIIVLFCVGLCMINFVIIEL